MERPNMYDIKYKGDVKVYTNSDTYSYSRDLDRYCDEIEQKLKVEELHNILSESYKEKI